MSSAEARLRIIEQDWSDEITLNAEKIEKYKKRIRVLDRAIRSIDIDVLCNKIHKPVAPELTDDQYGDDVIHITEEGLRHGKIERANKEYKDALKSLEMDPENRMTKVRHNIARYQLNRKIKYVKRKHKEACAGALKKLKKIFPLFKVAEHYDSNGVHWDVSDRPADEKTNE